eukprot:5141148-Amphidinium_carterae.1
MAVYVDDLLVAAPFDIVTSIQTSIEYEPGCKDMMSSYYIRRDIPMNSLTISTMLDKGLFQ